MDPAARSPTETNAALAAVEAAIRAARRAANGISMRFFISGEEATDPPRRPPAAHRPLDQLYQSQGGRGRGRRLLLPGHDDDTAQQSDTTRAAHSTTTTPQGEGQGRDATTTSPTVDAGSRGLGDSNEAPAFAAVIGLLAYGSCVVIGLLTEFDHTVGGWSAAAVVSYGLLLLLTTSLLGFGVMASVAGSSTMLRVSDLCARLGAILCSALLIVAISCKMGKPWGCAAGVPFAAVVACAMGAIGIWDRARALWDRVVGPRRRRQQPPGPGDENV
ncbi:unnamed protein product [Urochloa humidicola]